MDQSPAAGQVHEPWASGEVWINQCRTPARLAPSISDFGFWLRNTAGGWGGPHFRIHLLPPQFAALVQNAQGDNLDVDLAGSELGYVDECDGRAAADAGPHRRPLEKVRFKLERRDASTLFTFTGETGFLDLDSVRTSSRPSLERMAYWTFDLWFLIGDDVLESHFHSRRALAAVKQYVMDAGNG